MAKKGTIRVFQLAKELGVASKDIVAKCQAEDIPNIANHMSTVTVGLATTIREWFGVSASGEVHTALETAAKVDVPAVRAKAKKKAAKKTTTKKKVTKKTTTKAASGETDETTMSETATAVAEPPADIAAPTPEPSIEETTVSGPAEIEAVEEQVAAAASAPATEAPPAEGQEAVKPVMNVPQRPEVITPAGPMLQQPSRTKLAGPKIIRVEKPEELPPPRSRGGRPGGGGMGGPGPAGGGAGGRGAGGRMPPGAETTTPGRGGSRTGAGASRRNKRRSASAREGTGRTGRATSSEESNRNWREQDLREREHRLRHAGGFLRAARRDNLKRSTAGSVQRAQSAAQTGGSVKINEPISIKSLSSATGVKAADILRTLFLAGNPTSINAYIDSDTASEVMTEFNIDLEIIEQKTAEEQIVEQFREREMTDERSRAPVVTILGHVDHGKTSLLDRIRHANVAEGEAGGITQATSAFRVPVTLGDAERMITFIDTPGHEAFTEMRSRGAKMTDIVVLVVAADDGVMPQTVESINHAKAADVPIIVALNKTDKPEATDSNIQRILGQLAEHELNPIEWGGQTEVVRTSAVKDEGIQDLLEVIDLQAQILELTSDFGGAAEGSVIEAQLAEGRGPVARVLVQQGSLKQGDCVVVGRAYGRVRDIVNDRGERSKEAGPSMPIAISGINEVPDAGDRFYAVKNIKEAEAAAGERRQVERERDLATEKITLDNIFEHITASGRKELPLIVKADVQGSMETLKATLEKITNDEVSIAIKHAAVGGVNESDVALAEAAGAIVLGFNVTTSSAARKAAEARSVDIRLYEVIYDLTDDVTRAAEGLLEPELKLEVLGHAEVREVFRISKVGMIAGCYVTEGTVQRDAKIRVTRGDIVVEKDRRLEQLKRFKDDAKEVRAGQECGMRIEGYSDIKAGDVLECYKTLEVRRTLQPASA